MYIVVDERQALRSSFVANFEREGIPSVGILSREFHEWLVTASGDDLDAIQGFVLGDFVTRTNYAKDIRRYSMAPIFALSDERDLEETLDLLTSSFDDVVRKTVHVKEILARSQAVWRRVNSAQDEATRGPEDRLRVFFDGRDVEVDGEKIDFPRRERQILEYLMRNKGRRLTKQQIFNSVYGLYSESVDDSVIEGHVSKLRKKLRQLLGYDPIEAKRFIGYCYVGPSGSFLNLKPVF